jgi:hypothetical protein
MPRGTEAGLGLWLGEVEQTSDHEDFAKGRDQDRKCWVSIVFREPTLNA